MRPTETQSPRDLEELVELQIDCEPVGDVLDALAELLLTMEQDAE